MITKILKQMWNQRRMNSWIFIEIIIAGFFLWTVIDPMYVLTITHLKDKGYEEKGRYVMKLGAYGRNHGLRDTTLTAEHRKEAFLRITKLMGEQPEVEAHYVCLNQSLPNGGSWSGSSWVADTTGLTKENARERMIHSQIWKFYATPESDIFRTLGIKDATTGQEMKMPEKNIFFFVSETFAKRAFGTPQAVGQKIFNGNLQSIHIDGVFKDLKTCDFELSYPLCMNIDYGMRISDYTHLTTLVIFRLKDGVNFDTFQERFKKEVAPQMKQGNFYFDSFQPLSEYRYQLGVANGVYNKFRLHLSLASFTLLCIFLGMLGTFWIRSNARRGEIGLMRSMGATEKKVTKQFLIEAALIVTLGFAFSLALVVNFVFMAEGMSQPSVTGLMEHAITNEWLSPSVQFAMVSLITYLALLVIALVGTLIPVLRAVKVLPADALRDE